MTLLLYLFKVTATVQCHATDTPATVLLQVKQTSNDVKQY